MQFLNKNIYSLGIIFALSDKSFLTLSALCDKKQTKSRAIYNYNTVYMHYS